jgi:hypothetical protein
MKFSIRSLLRCLVFCFLVLQGSLFYFHSTSGPNNLSFFTSDGHSHTDDSPGYTINLNDEIRKSKAYVNSIQDTNRKLIFVHVPKTAGSTIEDVGAGQAKLSWGSCLFNHRPQRKLCKKPIMLYPNEFDWPMKVGYWHIPPHFFPLMGTNPYQDADLFAIVRDPVDRLLSEFYYVCRRKVKPKYCNRTRVHEPEYLNQWLRDELKSTKPSGQMTPSDLLYQNGHYTPQFDFVVSPGEVRMVDYVLHMKQLNAEFQPLMNAYGIDAKMPPRRNNAAPNDAQDLGSEHLDATTNAIVEEKYRHDFALMNAKQKD